MIAYTALDDFDRAFSWLERGYRERAFVIVYLPNRLLGVHFLGINLGDLKYLFFGLALVVLMIFRPQGVFPARQQLLAYGKAARDFLRRIPEEKPA